MFPRFKGVPERIFKIIPNCKFIYLVRNPIDRMLSQYRHLRAIGMETRPVELALLGPGLPGESLASGANPSLYVWDSLYALQVERYLEFFSLDRFLIMKSENLKSAREASLRAILLFLGLTPDWTAPVVHREFNVSAELRRPRRTTVLAQRIPGYRRLANAIPARAKELTKGLVTRSIDPGPVMIKPSLRQELTDLVRDDVAQLKAFLGPEFDGWGLL